MEPGPISSQERCSNSSSALARFLGKARIAIHGHSADLICEGMRVQKLHWQSWLPFHYCNGGGFRLYSPANSKDLRRKPFYRSILFDLTLLNVLPPLEHRVEEEAHMKLLIRRVGVPGGRKRFFW